MLSSGAAPTAIRINDDYVDGYYAEGSLLDLRPYLEKDGIKPDDYFPVAFNFPKQSDGAHAAWPIMTNPGVIYCNTDAFEEAGVELPPKDWADERLDLGRLPRRREEADQAERRAVGCTDLPGHLAGDRLAGQQRQ